MFKKLGLYEKLVYRSRCQVSNYIILSILFSGTGWEKNLTYEGKIYFVIAMFVISGSLIIRIIQICRSDKVAELEKEEKTKLYAVTIVNGIIIFAGAVLNAVTGLVINR